MGDQVGGSPVSTVLGGDQMSDEIPELKKSDFERAIPHKVRERIIQGRLSGGDDIALLRWDLITQPTAEQLLLLRV